MPSLELKLIAALIVIFGIGASGWYLHHSGYVEGRSEMERQIAIANEKAEKKLLDLNARVSLDQKMLEAQQQKIIQQSEKLNANQKDFDDLRNQYANDTKRLSVRTYRPSSPAKQDNNPAIAARASQNVQLMPDAAVALADLARGYTENMRLKNECIDLYNSARETIGK